MTKIWLALLVLLVVPVVLGEVVVSPNSVVLQVVRGSESVFSLQVWNNASYTAYDVRFSNISYFSFPKVFNLSAGESRNISYSVLTNDLFNNQYVSTMSFSYLINFTPPVKTAQINITSSGFQGLNTTIYQNDSVEWRNLLSQDVVVNDLSSGFSGFTIPALQSVVIQYSALAQYAFYMNVGGYSGGLGVVERSSTALAHDSTLDRAVVFQVRSVLPNNVYVLNVLSSNVSTSNNVSQVAIVEVKNTQDIQIVGVNLSASKWVSGFSANNFNLAPLENKIVFFNVTPSVARTNDTNVSHQLLITASSLNAGNTTALMGVFVLYQNMDTININGTTYTVTVLGINETIDACVQHMNDAGFERCQDLKRFGVNQTIIREVPAQYQFSEADIIAIKQALNLSGAVAERTENKMNLYLDYQDLVSQMVKNNSEEIKNWSASTQQFIQENKEKLTAERTRFWVFFSLVLLFSLISGILWLVDNIQYLELMIRAKQL